MVEYTAKRNPNRCPIHPGELLRKDVIPATGKTKSRAIAEGDDSVLVLEWANAAAEAIVNIARVRKVRGVILSELAAERSSDDRGQQRTLATSRWQELDPYMRLGALDRYERRSSARRDRAIRNIVRYTRGEE